MPNFFVYYEFPITRETIEGIVEDFGLPQSKVEELFDYYKKDKSLYAKFEIPEKPGLLVKLVKDFEAEILPHSVEGIMASVHSGSEGLLAVDWFRNFMRASLEKRNVPYTAYDQI
jgi:hypothetical protein